MPGPDSPSPLSVATVRGRLSGRLGLAVVVLAAVAACEEVLVNTIPVTSIQVAPDSTELFEGQSVQLSAVLLDDADEPLSGRDITWRTDDSTVATVDGAGLVVGAGSGTTTVRAMADGQTGTARVVILRLPAIELESPELSFIHTQGDTARLADRVEITNGGNGVLTGLATSIDYEAGLGGWLDVELRSTEAPTTLDVTVFPQTLEIGDYVASVWITGLDASNTPTRLEVRLQVREDRPERPTDLRVASVSPAGIRLAWSDNSDNEDEFRLERAVGADTFQVLTAVARNADAHLDDTVEDDAEYAYRVSACNTAGCSTRSNTATAVTAPTPASDLRVTTRSASELRLDWTDGSRTETEFRIQRRTGVEPFEVVATVGAGATTHLDPGLEPATQYEYTVVACNQSGCAAPSQVASGTTGDVPPAAPVGVAAATRSGSQIDVSWTDTSDNESEFRVERATDGSWAVIAAVDADATSFADTTAGTDTEYTYRVTACNEAGCSEPSGPATALTPPNIPSNLAAAAVSDTRIDLAWTDNSATETELRIERRVGTAAFQQVDVLPAGSRTYTSAGLDPRTEYDFRIRACNAGGCSPYSAVATATTLATPPPADPSSLSATLAGDGGSALLAWADNSGTETGFRVHRRIADGAYAVLATVPADTTAYTDAGVQTDAVHTYRVDACSAAGCSGYTNEASVTTAPTAPSGLQTSVVSATQVDVTWSDNSATEIEFRVERSTDGGAFATVGIVGAGVVAYTDGSTVPDTRYAYRVAACNARCSPYSETAATTTPPTAPSGLTPVTVSANRIDLGWTDNSATETEFRIERSTDGGSFTALASTGPGVTGYSDTSVVEDTRYSYRVAACNAAGCSAFDGPSPASTPPSAPSGLAASPVSDTEIALVWSDNSATETEFRIERRTGTNAFRTVGTVTENITAFRDSGLQPATIYEYRVVACSPVGCSPPSATASATTEAVPPPSGLTATVVSPAQIDLAWSDNSTTETEFRIERSVNGGSFTLLAVVQADMTSYSDAPVQSDTEYVYRVAACDGIGCSAYSNEAVAATAPASPSGLSATAASDTQIDLSWTDNSITETEFRIERRTGAEPFASVGTTASGITTFSDTGLDPATTYDYRVLACNATGCSVPSGTATATTDPIPAPSNLAATLVSSTQIDLTWTDNSTTETEFRVERNVNGGTFAVLAVVAQNGTAYSDTQIQGDTEYGYRAAACNPDTCSAYSGIVTVATAPVAPTNLTTATVSDSEIDLSWTDNSLTETEFRIERRIRGGFNLVATVGTDVTTFRDSGLTPLTQYQYRLSACNSSGCSGTTSPTDGATDSIPAPGSFTATAISADQVDLAWIDGSDAEIEFRIERSVDGGPYGSLATIAADRTTYSDIGTAEGTVYAYRMQACGAASCSGYATAADTTPPLAPSSLAATAVSATEIGLSWTDTSATETRFEIQRRVQGGTFADLTLPGANVTSYNDTGLTAATTYEYQIRACSDAGCSAYSLVATATTNAAP